MVKYMNVNWASYSLLGRFIIFTVQMHLLFINRLPLHSSWWRHQIETFSALLAICAGNSPGTWEFHAQRPVTRSFDNFFDLFLIKRLSNQWWGWWFETPSRPLWRHCTDSAYFLYLVQLSHYEIWYLPVTVTSQWCKDISNHREFDCSLNVFSR